MEAVSTATAKIPAPRQNLAPLLVPPWGEERFATPVPVAVPVNRHTAGTGAQPYSWLVRSHFLGAQNGPRASPSYGPIMLCVACMLSLSIGEMQMVFFWEGEEHARGETMSIGELACTYAVLILQDDGIPITAEKITSLVKAANVNVESYWPNLFAKLAEKRNVEDLILSAASGGAGGAVVAVAAPAGGGGGGGAAANAAPPPEEKKEEPKEESDEDMGFSLFD
ncbi:60S acidic ribosomal protein P1-2 [Morella rubra]|uniref:60S acidic ribosomal protein P1-2 n=1 Tax=Morella rubra TaxID=262757 RepID=A0A6A1W431_9ROSI|nr:60S acidic ribosomal protein P1-2 [Morella rubra]